MKIPTPVKMFKKRRAEVGEPNKLLFDVKLASPAFSGGILKKMIVIKKRLIKAPSSLNINTF